MRNFHKVSIGDNASAREEADGQSRGEGTLRSGDPVIREKDGDVIPDEGDVVDADRDAGPVARREIGEQGLRAVDFDDVHRGIGEKLCAAFVLRDLRGVQGDVFVAERNEGEGGEKEGEKKPEKG